MAYRRLIVDGYCLLHRIPGLPQRLPDRFAAARRRLLRLVEQSVPELAESAVVVFDGRGRQSEEDTATVAVEVLFAPPDQTADTVIERMVHAAPEPVRLLVVTSDHLEAQTVSAAGAEVMSCAEFIDRVEALVRRGPQRTPKKRGPTLGDIFPAG